MKSVIDHNQGLNICGVECLTILYHQSIILYSLCLCYLFYLTSHGLISLLKWFSVSQQGKVFKKTNAYAWLSQTIAHYPLNNEKQF